MDLKDKKRKTKSTTINVMTQSHEPWLGPLIRIVEFVGFEDRLKTVSRVSKAFNVTCVKSLPNSMFIISNKQFDNLSEKRIMKFLKDKTIGNDPTMLLGMASAMGHLKLIALLLNDKRTSPTAFGNGAIRTAIRNNQHEAVQLLLKDGRSDPSYWNNIAIDTAISNGRDSMVNLLLTDTRVSIVALKFNQTDILEYM